MKGLFFKTKTIGNRLLIMLTGIAIVSSITTALALYVNEVIRIDKDQQSQLNIIATVLAPNLAASRLFDDNETTQELIEPLINKMSIIGAEVIDEKGLVVAASYSKQASVEFVNVKSEALQSKPAQQHRITDNTNEIIFPLTFDGLNLGALRIVSDKRYKQQRSEFYINFLIIVMLVNGLLSLFVALFLTNRFTQPILSLANAARYVSQTGDYNIRVKPISNDEISDLTLHLNDMLEKIGNRDQYLENQVSSRTEAIAEANSQLQKQALYDTLTDLPNRRYFYKELAALVDPTKVPDRSVTIMFIDLDGFKEVNDTLGHDVGDILLKDTAARLLACVRTTDFVARLGGDEFTLVMEGIAKTSIVDDIANNLLAQLNKPFKTENGEDIFVSGSIGITQYPKDGTDIEKLIKNADQAMYAAKRNGRNCFYHFDQAMEEQLIHRKRLSDELRQAVARHEFSFHYQPIISLETGKITKLEALLRWNHPRRGMVYPDAFIQTAEDLGLLTEISQQTYPESIKQLARWRQDFGNDLQISLNASPSQFRKSSNWLLRLENDLQRFQLDGSALMFEITENLTFNLDIEIQRQLNKIKNFGIDLAIDDFGTGYSSLARLRQLEIKIIKIDKRFIENICENPDDFAICKAIIVMAHELRLKVIAEGVENLDQVTLLKKANCDYIQGFYYSEPQSADSISKLLATPNLLS